MVEESKIRELISGRIEGTDLFLVNVLIGHSNDIRVHVDTMEGVKIEECVALSRWLASELDLIDDNYSLEVSSPGLGSPLLLREQYLKNIDRDVEVVFTDGKKKKGRLLGVEEDGISLEYTEKQVVAGGSQKKKKDVLVSGAFKFEEIKSTKVIITF